MGMTKVQFDDFSAAMDSAFDDLVAAQTTRDGFSGGVEAAQADMDEAVGDVLAKARALDLLVIQFKTSFSDAAGITPYIQIADPIDGSEDVAVDAPISITFSRPMDPATVTTSTCYVLDGVTHVPASIAMDDVNLVATITPDDPLDADTLYKIHVTTGVEDSGGSALANAFEQENGWTTIAA